MLKKSYRFANFILDSEKRYFSKNNLEIELTDYEFDVLLYLVENRLRFCSKNEIINTVWGIIVSDNSVEKIVSKLRKIFDDNVNEPKFIKSRRGKGYSFIFNKVSELENTVPARIDKNIEISASPQIRIPLNYKTLILCGCLFVLSLAIGVVLLKGSDILEKLNATNILADDFSREDINPKLWTISGSSVKVVDGKAQVVCLKTDDCGRLVSNFVSFDPNKSLIIKSRIKVSYAQNMKEKNYCLGFFGITPKNPHLEDRDTRDKSIFGIYYANYDYSELYPNGEIDSFPTEGWFLFRNGGAPNKKVDYRDGKVSKKLAPLWDTWFEQKIIYNPSNQTLSLFINGQLCDVFETGDLFKDIEENKIRVEIAPRGWFRYHAIEVDYIEIYQ